MCLTPEHAFGRLMRWVDRIRGTAIPPGDYLMATTDNRTHDKPRVRTIGRDQDGITLEMPVTFLKPRSASLSSWRQWLTEHAAFSNVRVEQLDEALDVLARAIPPTS